MTGGMARIYLLGRNSDENEPWPDVLGVSVVFLLTVMFMLGLEVFEIRRTEKTTTLLGRLDFELLFFWGSKGQEKYFKRIDFTLFYISRAKFGQNRGEIRVFGL